MHLKQPSIDAAAAFCDTVLQTTGIMEDVVLGLAERALANKKGLRDVAYLMNRPQNMSVGWVGVGDCVELLKLKGCLETCECLQCQDHSGLCVRTSQHYISKVLAWSLQDIRSQLLRWKTYQPAKCRYRVI